MNSDKYIAIKSIRTGRSGARPALSPKEASIRRPSMRLYSKTFFWVLIVVIGFIAGGAGSLMTNHYILPYLSTIPFFAQYSLLQPDKPVVIEKNERVTLVEESSIIDAVKKISPSVVSITSERDLQGFFGNVFQQKAGGTGFILTNDGLIATNKHVVADEQARYTVVTANGQTFAAQVLARDPVNDFAVIKIAAENLPVAELGNSQDLQVGQRVIAIGNTLGEYQNTVTTGVVSGIGRSLTVGDGTFQTEALEDVIQTDAAINPGNSGGPLVNILGQVVGINTAIDRQGQLVGFAIPIDNLKNVIESVIREGKIVRPYIGIRYIPLNPQFAQANKLPSEKGALIYSGDPQLLPVLPNSPAQAAGLKSMDIITKINGETIDANHSLARLIQKYKPGEEITLTVIREKNTLEIKVVLSKMEEE